MDRHTSGRQKHAKRAGDLDAHIGSRIRLARTSRDMSQEALSYRLGISFQQVQKYERGSNRISASRLFAVADILKEPIAYFFEGRDRMPGREPATAPQPVRLKKNGPARRRVIKVLERLLAEETTG